MAPYTPPTAPALAASVPDLEPRKNAAASSPTAAHISPSTALIASTAASTTAAADSSAVPAVLTNILHRSPSLASAASAANASASSTASSARSSPAPGVSAAADGPSRSSLRHRRRPSNTSFETDLLRHAEERDSSASGEASGDDSDSGPSPRDGGDDDDDHRPDTSKPSLTTLPQGAATTNVLASAALRPAAPGFVQPQAPLTKDPLDFYWDKVNPSEPHAIRRSAILRAHPEIKQLMGHCPRTKYVVAATVVFQLAMAAFVSRLSWLWVVVLAYVVAGTLNHMMMMAMHEIAHNLAFRGRLPNRILALIANLPVGIPAAASFRRYHLEHHKYQGEDVVDVDVPTSLEARLFNSTPGKLLWCLLQPAFYALRPVFVNPKKPGRWEFMNIAIVVAYDVLLYSCFGGKALFYTIGGSLLGMGLHPVAGHFIAEHYVFAPGQETYSYYGILNWVTFNVGYHNEHHDFSNIPGSRLPQLKAMAPEFYDCLPYYKSWTAVIVDFIFNTHLSGFSRVKRSTLTPEARKEIYDREHRHEA